jgi:hypothetical protein
MAFVFGSNETSAPASKAERRKAKIWLNIGYQKGDKFVNLPVGIPVDTTEHLEIRGQNEDWNKFQSARNAFLDALVKMGMSLEAGGEEVIEGLTIKIKHVAEAATVEDADNDYIVDFGAMLKKKDEEKEVKKQKAS